MEALSCNHKLTWRDVKSVGALSQFRESNPSVSKHVNGCMYT